MVAPSPSAAGGMTGASTSSTAASPPWACELHDEHAHDDRSERRVAWVVAVTVATMLVELVAGYLTGSLALLADGWHMASHAGAMGLASAAYWLARSRASHKVFVFGTGKVYALAGYSNGVALGLIGVLMMIEAVARLRAPEAIRFGEALPVAIVGLVVNLVSARLLKDRGGHQGGHHHHHHADPNLKAAYIHVLADALTSVLAIVALALGLRYGWAFLDSVGGLLGGVVIAVWSVGLCRTTARQLLDLAPSRRSEERIRELLSGIDDVRVCDLHLWEIAPGRYGCVVSIETTQPREVVYYRERLLADMPLTHLTVEVHRR